MSDKKQNVATLIFYCVVGLIAITSIVFVTPVYRKHEEMKKRLNYLEEELARKNAECVKLNRLVHDMRHDPETVEKIAREKFGLCRPGEIIYKYDDAPDSKVKER